MTKRKIQFVWVVEKWIENKKQHVRIDAFGVRENARNCWGEYYHDDKVRIRKYFRTK